MSKLNEYRVTIKSRKGTIGRIDADVVVDLNTACKVLELLRVYVATKSTKSKEDSNE